MYYILCIITYSLKLMSRTPTPNNSTVIAWIAMSADIHNPNRMYG